MLAAPSGATWAAHYEHQLVAIADNIRSGHVKEALVAARAITERHPQSRVARLLYADLLTARLSKLSGIGSSADNNGEDGLADLRQELVARWSRSKTDDTVFDALLPDKLLQAAPSTDHVVFADLTNSRLYLYRNDEGTLRLMDDFYVTQGLNGPGKQKEGDQRTPVGVYYVTGYIPGSTLPSRYGPGALPISYPNPIDQRYRRTGYGIWIHGTEPFLLNRAPLASDGCLSLNNNDFMRLSRSINEPRHTPVIIDNAPNWVQRQTLRSRREELLIVLENWRQDWESMNPDSYLAHYDSESFTDGVRNYQEWAGRKRAVLAAQQDISVTLRDVELLGYPGEPGTFLAEFEQTFKSPTFQSTIRKQQYWKRVDDGWRIIYEGTSEKSPPPSMVEEPTNGTESDVEPASS